MSARHNMPLETAQSAADELAEDLAEKFDIDYGWDGDFIHFERPGVDGSIHVSAEQIHIQARLGLLLSFLQSRIENEIRGYLSSHFDCEIENHSA
ncbi:MAG: polyhydroxyalkanoic acid system family protein [Xanthomonadales bacterium]|nr:polyhydroxyalkanoic acid system family protein [Xanthomonadales bacterium]